MAIKFGDVFNTSDLNINNPKLEEMLNKTKNAAEVFGKKSAERIEISKKKIELFDYYILDYSHYHPQHIHSS